MSVVIMINIMLEEIIEFSMTDVAGYSESLFE